MSHQDWTPAVIRKSQKQINEEAKKKHTSNVGNIFKKFGGGVNHTTTNVSHLDVNDVPTQKKVNPDLKKQICDARLEKGLTKQKDLAQRANVNVKIIKEIEQGKMPDQGSLNKICRALGIKLIKRVKK